MNKDFLSTSKDDLLKRGWQELDIILVTGDAYVDHPSYGTSLIGRILEDDGFKVGIIAQPDWKKTDDFKRLGRPKLFFGVTAGNIDSMVANYTANKKRRSTDDYSPGGKAGLRPDRATIIYANRIREAFPNIPVVIGGIEASLRRLTHYDYWSDQVRRSILLDSKADILVYGMGERQILEIARRLQNGADRHGLDSIKGTVVVKNEIGSLKDFILIPSFEEVNSSKEKFSSAFKTIYSEFDPFRGKTLVQQHDKRFVVQYLPAEPLTAKELDKIYDLDYARTWHPVYDRTGGVPGFETVRFSITSHRGCPGACNFCSLYLHQGRIVQSRSIESIVRETRLLASRKDFKGTITDIGGPTANLYRAACSRWEKEGVCKDKKCLVPLKCKNLKLGYTDTIKLWKEVMNIPRVKHVFIGSGVRYDLLVDEESDEYLKELCAHHVSGQLKVAPEHSERSVLELMNKPSFDIYEKFIHRFSEVNSRLKKKQYLVNYFISGHPGAGLSEALNLSLTLAGRNIHPEQIQDFIPLPMTISGCMYYTGKDPFTLRDIYVSKGLRERKLQRALLQYTQPNNRKYVIEALKKLNKLNLKNRFF